MRKLAYVVFVSLVAFGVPARADIPPPDACTAPGQPCTNAGANHAQAGSCTMSTCTRAVPSPDGGMMSMSYQCNLCKVADGGSGGGTGSGGASGGTGSGGTSGGSGSGGMTGNKPPVSKDSGCAVAGGMVGGSPGAALLLAGVLGFIRARRRRS